MRGFGGIFPLVPEGDMEGTKRSSELFEERLELAQGDCAGGCCVVRADTRRGCGSLILVCCACLQRCPSKHSRGFAALQTISVTLQ
jgi:hypothetical protein